MVDSKDNVKDQVALQSDKVDFNSLDLMKQFQKIVNDAVKVATEQQPNVLDFSLDCPLSAVEKALSAPAEKESPLTPREAANVAEFQARWKESMKSAGLADGPLQPLFEELGQQLASGKIDAAKLQELMKKGCFTDEDVEKVSKALRALNKDLRDMYGLEMRFGFKGSNDQVTIKEITVSEAMVVRGPRNSVTVSNSEDPKYSVEIVGGFAGPIEHETSAKKAMSALRDHIVQGRRDLKR